jgi:Fe-S oxidoreductase
VAEVSKKIVYYSGCFANYYDPEVGKALVRVLEKNGFEVIVPEQKCCGMPMMANWNIKGAEKNARYNLESLVKAAADGLDIITTCPSCYFMLKKEYLNFFDSDKARFVSEHLHFIDDYLLALQRAGELDTSFGELPLKVVYKVPCHLKVQNIIKEPVELLKLIPGLSVIGVNATCCGMGGSYGMKKSNYDMGVELAARVWEEVREAQPDKAVTDCGGCKLQIEAGTGVQVLHPIVLLDRAYKSYRA